MVALPCVYVLCVDKKAGYNDRQSNGSGKSLKYSFSNEATSCGLVSESNVFNEPQSSSSRNCRQKQKHVSHEIIRCNIVSVKGIHWPTSLIRRFEVLTRNMPTTCKP